MNMDVLFARLEQHVGHTDLRKGPYTGEEYEYKREISKKVQAALDEQALNELVDRQDWKGICQRAVDAFKHKFGLARWSDYQWLRYLDPEEQKGFVQALVEFLYGSGPILDRLERFVGEATDVYAHFRARDVALQKQYRGKNLTWPFVSYFHFMLWPDQEYAFIKPDYLGEAARAAGFDLQYQSKPNCRTYARAQEFYRALWPTVQNMGGRDWIDVQTLIHIVGGGYGTPEGGWVDKPEPVTEEPTKEQIMESATPTSRYQDGELQPPSLRNVLDYVAASPYIFDPNTITNYHLSVLTNPFVILTGLSGTGKTKLTRLYADAVYGIQQGRDNPYYAIVAVKPEWTDGRGLLGYYNPLTRSYEATPFLRFLLKAAADPAHWCFLCLDEMNLARVEYYFADFLSAMESKEAITLHGHEGCVAAQPGEDVALYLDLGDAQARGFEVDGTLYVPPALHIPPNLIVSGTVNVDETTHAFSDKVLDRANSIEFNHTDLDSFADRYVERFPERADLVREVVPLLREVYALLEPSYLHFGYRTLEEVLGYLWQNVILGEEVRRSSAEVLDNQLMQKVLPKLRGDERVHETLVQLRTTLAGVIGEGSRSVSKLTWMLDELAAFGSTQFWR